LDVYVRKCGESNSSATVAADCGLEDAHTTAVGTPVAISFAIEGPTIATTRFESPSSFATTPVAGIRDSSSHPLVATAQMQSPGVCFAMARTVGTSPAVATASTSTSALGSTSSHPSCSTIVSPSGNATPRLRSEEHTSELQS